MIETLFGSSIRERVLLYLFSHGEGYSREMSRHFNTDISQIQKQVERLEAGGVISGRNVGKTKVYRINSQYPLYGELNALLGKALSLSPMAENQLTANLSEAPASIGRTSEAKSSLFQSYDPDLVD
jgi:hypothetical protein